MNRRHTLAIAGVGSVACVLALLTFGTPGAAQTVEVPSEEAAIELENKIRMIEAAVSEVPRGRETIEVSELELESYVLYGLEDQLAVQINAVDLEIRSGELAATADMFVDEALVSSQPLVGPLFEGEHTLFFEGAFRANGGQGRFNLQRVTVDGITVPVFLVKALLESLDEPVDLDAPIEIPIGIDEVMLIDRAVSVTY